MDRECKAEERRLLIQWRACELVVERGYDGFTMDDLADAAGVSRRTLFNHVSDKASAVLGPDHREDSPAMVLFASGGPSGELYHDLVALLMTKLEGFGAEPDALARHRLYERAVAADPKLHALFLERTQRALGELAEAICGRQGWPSGDLRAKAVTASMFALVRLALAELEHRPDGESLSGIFREVLEAQAAVLPRVPLT